MKKVFKKGICLFLALLMLTSGISVFAFDTAAANSSPRIFIIGDSTACSYEEWDGSLRTGWGEALQNFLTDPKMIVNAASSGASARSFYDREFNWNPVKARLNKGDYLLIQFGINDSSNENSRYSDPAKKVEEHDPENEIYSFKWYLAQYIDYAFDIGANPVLVTSVENRLDGKKDNEKDSDLYEYVMAIKELAKAYADEGKEVPVIDVWSRVRSAIKAMEAEQENSSAMWYVDSVDGEGENDNTHLVEKGAMEVARIFANEIKTSTANSAQNLASYLVNNVDSVTTHTDIIGVNENFEDYTISDDSNVRLGVPFKINKGDSDYPDKYVQIVKENEQNNMLKLSYGATAGIYMLRYPLPVEATSGYYKLKYRFYAEPKATDSATASVITFTTYVGEYAANTRYGKKNVNGVSNTLVPGQWYDVEYYANLTEGNLRILFEDEDLKSAGWSMSKSIKSVQIGFGSNISNTTSGAGENAILYLDDIEFGEITEEDYNIALDIMPSVTLPEGITAQENFEQYSVPGTTIGTTLWGWSSYNTDANTPITYETEPGNPANKVARFESKLNRTNTHRTLKYDLPSVLEDGVYSVKFRLRSGDDDSNTFWLSVLDTQASKNRHYIAFRLFGNEVAMVSRADGENDIVSAEYDFNLTDWFDIEVVYDLTAVDAAYATVYVNGTKVLNNVLVGGATSELNNGTINSIQFQISNAYNATQISSTGTAEDGVFAAFLLDDIVIKQTSIVTGVTAAEGNLSTISAYFDKAPSTAPKFVAAVYDGRALKDVAFANATAMVGTQSATLSKQLSVESGNTVKVYYWDMTNLIPCIKMFETDIQ